MRDAALRRYHHAERARRYRARLSAGRVVVSICIEPERLVPMLVAGRYLRAETEDRNEIAGAIDRMLGDAVAAFEASFLP